MFRSRWWRGFGYAYSGGVETGSFANFDKTENGGNES
jgi:hypothetical protein